MIEFHDVRKNYHVRGGINRVLRGANLTILPGEKVGILGRNGAGKSTTIRLLSGAELPSSGTVERTMSVSWPLAFGGAFQGALTGRDNAKCISRIYGKDIHDTLDFVQDFAELGMYLDEPVRTYSSGMAARLAFAISMSIEFDCFLIDEIVHVGDHKFHQKCQVELFEKRADRALVIVSHSEDFVREHCERAYVLRDGIFHSFADVDEAIEFHTQAFHVEGRSHAVAITPPPNQDPNALYLSHPIARERDGVKRGTQIELSVPPSDIFPDCQHLAWLYRPVCQKDHTPLPLMVFTDGWWFKADDGPWRVPVILDNLIADGLLPPMAALFIEPGKSFSGAGNQKSLEYDRTDGDYAQFLEETVFPEVAKHVTISEDPELRAIVGFGNGGVCAFNAAWERPDLFGKVVSFCSSFVDPESADTYSRHVVSCEARSIRIFMQIGRNARAHGEQTTLDLFQGNAKLANALIAKGYDCQFIAGEGDFSHLHGASVLPDAFRWLWR